MKSYKEYFTEHIEGRPLKDIVEDARRELPITVNLNHNEKDVYISREIPLNLERLYFNELIDNHNYTEAEKVLQRMRFSYTESDEQNFIEAYEYHLKSILQSEKIITQQIDEAKKEFNRHTVTLMSIIVGVITIFGTAKETLTAGNFKEGFLNFFVISFTIIFLIFMISEINKRSRK